MKAEAIRRAWKKAIVSRLELDSARLDLIDHSNRLVVLRVLAFASLNAIGHWFEAEATPLPEGDPLRADLWGIAGVLYELAHRASGLGTGKVDLRKLEE